VRTFQSFTADIERLANWLISVGITTVAMKSLDANFQHQSNSQRTGTDRSMEKTRYVLGSRLSSNNKVFW
jgi:hypothetical protein